MNTSDKITTKPLLKQQGFTLLELLVVVSILAAMAGIATSAVDLYNERAREELVHVEMNNIADAIYKFQTDTGYFPKTGVYSNNNISNDLSSLYLAPTEGVVWDSAIGIGWNGPYMAKNTQQRMHYKGADSQSNCELEQLGVLNASNSFIAIEDPFQRAREGKFGYSSQSQCFVILNTKRNKLSTTRESIARSYAGQAYRYEVNFKNNLYPDCVESGNGCVALTSLGKNGIYESYPSADPLAVDCSVDTCDDIVKVLRVNK